MQTERVTFLTTPKVKAALSARAAALGISTGEYIRRKVEDEEALTPDQEAELAAVVEQVNEAIPKMSEALDRMSRSASAVHREIDAFLREKGIRG
jgi:predicted transglutaminase-like cysteine proteinase